MRKQNGNFNKTLTNITTTSTTEKFYIENTNSFAQNVAFETKTLNLIQTITLNIHDIL